MIQTPKADISVCKRWIWKDKTI